MMRMRESIVCARRARDGTNTIGIAYGHRNEVSLSSDSTIVARHSCSVGRLPVEDGDWTHVCDGDWTQVTQQVLYR